jgi:hypothetical protein
VVLAVCSVWRLVFRSPEFAPEFGPSYPSCGSTRRIFPTTSRGSLHVTLRVCLVRTAATIMLESPRSKVCAAWVSGVGATVNYDSS